MAQAVYAWRVTPREDGYSPFDLMFARKGRLPGMPTIQGRTVDIIDAELAKDKSQQANDRKQCIHTKELPALKEGQAVWMQNEASKRWDVPARVLTQRRGGHSYTLRAQDGTTYIRSRRLLRLNTSAEHATASE